ncbi:MAG: glutathione S-transferase [Pseudomonadota bacterium]
MTPILYSFRRCPYAIRARLALHASGQMVELREVLLRDKAPEFLAASPSATVPCLVTDEQVIDESIDVMIWALSRHDPERWLDMPSVGWDLIAEADGPFKAALDRTKYHSRYGSDPEVERGKAMEFLAKLNAHLHGARYLFGDQPSVADIAILPFVRQFAFVDKARFDAEAGADLCRWFERFLNSASFGAVMQKYPVWQNGDPVTHFPELSN